MENGYTLLAYYVHFEQKELRTPAWSIEQECIQSLKQSHKMLVYRKQHRRVVSANFFWEIAYDILWLNKHLDLSWDSENYNVNQSHVTAHGHNIVLKHPCSWATAALNRETLACKTRAMSANREGMLNGLIDEHDSDCSSPDVRYSGENQNMDTCICCVLFTFTLCVVRPVFLQKS